MIRRSLFCLSAVLILLGATTTILADVPDSIGYQGVLTSGGVPVTHPVTVYFRIFDAATGGTMIWESDNVPFNSDDGTFSTYLRGGTPPLCEEIFAGPNRWLEMTVEPDPPMDRVPLVTTPYAYRVATVDGATGGNITSNVSIGPSHTNTGLHSFIAGSQNEASGEYTVVSGGILNTASGHGAAVGGGSHNTAAGIKSFACGDHCTVDGDHSVISGGVRNHVIGVHSFIGGGVDDTVTADYAAIVGGGDNNADGLYSFIGGGSGNRASGYRSTVSGGKDNIASGQSATCGGGGANNAYGQSSVIGGGEANYTGEQHATIAGGNSNIAGDIGAFVGGGRKQPCTR